MARLQTGRSPSRCSLTLTCLGRTARVARLVPASTKFPGGLRLLATLAVVVLVFGLPRLLRTCDHGDHRHLVVAFGGCGHTHDDARATGQPPAIEDVGDDDGDDTDGGDERAPTLHPDERGCSSACSAFELGAPPRPFALALAATAPSVATTPWLPPAAQRRPTPPPPATGPPRPDERTALRGTTRLQV